MKTRSVLLWGPVALASLGGCGVFGGKDGKRTPTVGDRVAVLNVENVITADPALASIPVTLPPAVANTEWTQASGNPQHAPGHLALAPTIRLAWSRSIGEGAGKTARLAASPVVAGGRVYTIDTTSTVRAFDAGTGAPVWSARAGVAGDGNRGALFGGGVAVDGGRVYATNGLGAVTALDAATGAPVWTVRPGGPLRGAPTVADGQLYVMSQDSQIYALRASNGETLWSEAAALETAGVFGTSAPAYAQGTVVAGFASGDLNAYRYENGRVVWDDQLSRTAISTTVGTLSDIDADPVIDAGRVFALGQGGRMVALELVTGQRLWELNVGGISTPWVAGEWIFVVTDDARLLAVSRTNGRVRWVTQLQRFRDAEDRKGQISWVGPVLAGDRLVLANSAGQMTFVNPADGSVLGTTKLGEAVSLQPVVANGTLFILDDTGRLSAFRG